jgi:uncharacterized membrane protein YvbJ
MNAVQCIKCSAAVPAGAKFCPRCGHDMDDSAPAGADATGEKWPSKSRMPFAGLLFLVTAILGPILVFGGIYTGSGVLLLGGIVVCVLLVVLLLLGMVF